MVEFWCWCIPRISLRSSTITFAAVSFHSLSWHWSPYLESLEISTAVRVFSNMLWGFVILQKQADSNATSDSLQIDTEICTHNETILVVRNVVVAILLILFSVLFARVSSSYARKLEKRFKRITPAPSLSTLTVASISTTDFNPHA
ncbi:8674_t:CDS:2 [Cetraspora pellucida]|uniref:8674_t:CDS:1 n=1 Tax=Cetraspora pellucida TaxID=1433469 RepID=A0ACA9KSX2_9GLOM|nr:8674_t:CDS:2 [Cetraspora pellucida]